MMGHGEKKVRGRLKAMASAKSKLEARRRRVARLLRDIAIEEQKATSRSQKAVRPESVASGVTSATKKLNDFRARLAKTESEIEALSATVGVEAEPGQASKFEEELVLPVGGTIRRADAFVERARAFGERYGIEGLVETVDLDDGPVQVINMHKARLAKVAPEKGIWPSFFAVEESTEEEAAHRRSRLDALLATAEPGMERVVGLLSTPGMLHMAMLEALSLVGNVLPVSEDPGILGQGREALKDFRVIDANVYVKLLQKE